MTPEPAMDEMPPLPTQKDGQAMTMTRVELDPKGDSAPEAGHWFSPNAVRERVDAACAARDAQWAERLKAAEPVAFETALALAGFYEATWVGDLGDPRKFYDAALRSQDPAPAG